MSIIDQDNGQRSLLADSYKMAGRLYTGCFKMAQTYRGDIIF